MQNTLARKLRVLRAERGLTLREAAQRTGVDKDTLSKLERGTRHPHDVTISRLAKGYDVSVEELLEEPALAGTPGGTPGRAEAPTWLVLEVLSNEELREAALKLSDDIKWNRTYESAQAETPQERVTRVLNLTTIDAIGKELRRRGEEPLETLIPAYRRWKRVMTTPTEVAEHETDAGDSETAEAG
jgi:transcriptional regulator with XRE-family HTH domain